MKERPILFSAPMVRALLDGSKTQTRRIINPQPVWLYGDGMHAHYAWKDGIFALDMYPRNSTLLEHCPHGQIGDHLWVRESTHRRPMLNLLTGEPLAPQYDGGAYSADDADVLTPEGFDISWWYSRKACPSIHMPRWACRILREITGVRVERLQDISEQDAIAEGIEKNWTGDPAVGQNGFGGQGWVPDCGWRNYMEDVDGDPAYTPEESFQTLWQSINGRESWAANPWVWTVEFKSVAQLQQAA